MHISDNPEGLVRWVAIAFFFIVLIATIVPAKADTSTWIANTPVLQKDGDLPSGAIIPFAINGNRDCVDHKFVTRPFRILQTEISQTACGAQSSYGIVDPNGWLELSGTHTSGKLINSAGYLNGSIPVPNSNDLINYTSAPSGLYLHLTKNLPSAIIASVSSSGEVEYRVNRPANVSLRDRANNLLQVQTDSLSFSSNGKWMVVDGRFRSMFRVNLETFEVLPFAPTFNYDIGVAPGIQSAISSDGRYAVVYSKSFTTFKIYNLDTCGTVPNVINAPVACQSRDLLPFMHQQLMGFQGVSHIRFISDDILGFYGNYHATPGLAATNKIAKLRLSANVSTAAKIELLALGDSYISGEGVFEYQAGTDVPDNRCHLSLASYPYLVSQIVSFESGRSVACSGAKITDVLNRSDEYEGQVNDGQKRRQRNSTAILSSFSPGYINQLDFVVAHLPEKILVSVGGNDVGFSKILRRCLAPDTCFSTYEDRLELVREINGKFPTLVDTYKKIKEAGFPNAKIYAVGYPQIVKPGGDCGLNVRLNAQELEFARLITVYLNSVIKAAADRSGIGFVDTQNALDGHRLCEARSNGIAVNGLTAGDNTPTFLRGPIGNESYHPNKFGHQLLSNSILTGSESLTKAMPTAIPASSPPPEVGVGILNAPKTNRSINKLNYDDDLANDIEYREAWWELTVSGLRYSLKALAPFSIFLNSEPTNLGTFNTGNDGSLAVQIRIPAAIPTGFHTLHVYGSNIAGEPVDIYKTIYVAANEIDYDGDGLSNGADSCSTMENSGIDHDQDGIDDACDGFIGDAPPRALPSVIEPLDGNSVTSSNSDEGGTSVANHLDAPQTVQTTGEIRGIQASASLGIATQGQTDGIQDSKYKFAAKDTETGSSNGNSNLFNPTTPVNWTLLTLPFIGGVLALVTLRVTRHWRLGY